MALALHSAHRFFCFRRWALSPRPIFFIPSLFIDISSIIGPVQQAPGVMSILIEPIFLGHIFGPSCCSMDARDQLSGTRLLRNPARLRPASWRFILGRRRTLPQFFLESGAAIGAVEITHHICGGQEA